MEENDEQSAIPATTTAAGIFVLTGSDPGIPSAGVSRACFSRERKVADRIS